jgi:hypothetical protein
MTGRFRARGAGRPLRRARQASGLDSDERRLAPHRAGDGACTFIRSTKPLAGGSCLAVTWSAISFAGAARRQLAGAELAMTEVVAEKAFIGEERPAKGGPFLAGRLNST